MSQNPTTDCRMQLIRRRMKSREFDIFMGATEII
jgi:hypothetical protein